MIELQTEGGAETPPQPVDPAIFETRNPVPDEVIRRNIRLSLARDLPEMREGPITSEQIALVGGGPSLKNTMPTLRRLADVGTKIVACGSVHDFLIGEGIVPWTATALDPLPEMAGFYARPHADVTYLMASQCDPSVFDALAGQNIVLWHAAVGVEDAPWPEGRPLIGGGCTIVLRSIWLLSIVGFRTMHLFGFDGCDDPQTGAHHAYEAVPDGEVQRYFVGRPDGRHYDVRGPLIAQAYGWNAFLKRYGDLFTFIIHGDGLMAEIMRQAYVQPQESA